MIGLFNGLLYSPMLNSTKNLLYLVDTCVDLLQKLQPGRFLGVRHYCYEEHTKHAKHAKARGSGGMPPRKILKITCSEIASEYIFGCKQKN